MEINCIVIDDEPLAVSKLEDFIARVPGLNLLRTFDNAVEALSWLRENRTDLIFLDIQMEQLSGIQFLEATGLNTGIIVTSAYDQYAIKGFELNVTDYLLKPFSFQRFLKAVNKAAELIILKADPKKEQEEESRYIFVKTEYRLEKVDIGDILYIEGMKDYLRIVCTTKKIMTLQSFAKLEETLPPKKFCRVHKSFIVSLDKIDSIDRGVVIISKQRIPVSSTYKEIFYEKIGLPLPKQNKP
jgi:two-component system, LytTR family, response regulator